MKICISGSQPEKKVTEEECKKCSDLELCKQIKTDLGLVDP